MKKKGKIIVEHTVTEIVRETVVEESSGSSGSSNDGWVDIDL